MPVDIETAIERLTLFNSKAAKLEKSSFIAKLQGGDVGFSMHATLDQITFQITGDPPDEESTDSFILTWRMFWRDGDGISLREMSSLYEEAPVTQVLKDEYAKLRSEINAHLDSPPYMKTVEDGHTYTRREIMDTFLYGEMAHINPRLKRIYDRWQANQLDSIMRFEFLGALHDGLLGLLMARQIHLRALNELEQQR